MAKAEPATSRKSIFKRDVSGFLAVTILVVVAYFLVTGPPSTGGQHASNESNTLRAIIDSKGWPHAATYRLRVLDSEDATVLYAEFPCTTEMSVAFREIPPVLLWEGDRLTVRVPDEPELSFDFTTR